MKCDFTVSQIQDETGGKKCGYFELAVCPKYNRDYWLYVEIKETAALKDIDQFLRDIWVECCGHLSAFDINGISYDVAPQDDYFWGKRMAYFQGQVEYPKAFKYVNNRDYVFAAVAGASDKILPVLNNGDI